MSKKAPPLMVKVYHEDHPEHCTYLFGTYGHLTNQNNIATVAKLVAESKQFQESDYLIIEQGKLVQPKKSNSSEQSSSEQAASEQASDEEEEVDTKKQQAQENQQAQEGQEAEEKDPHKHSIDAKTTISQTLYHAAKELGKPTYPFDTPTHVDLQKWKVRGNAVTKPHNLVKALGIFATGPIGWGIYLGLRNKKDHQDDIANQRSYMQGQTNVIMEHLYDEPMCRKHLIKERNLKWLQQGYDGKKGTSLTEKPLFDLIKEENIFVSVSLGHIFDKDYGLIALLDGQNGYHCEVVEDWQFSPEELNNEEPHTFDVKCA